jgi:hypothetical protein
MRIVTRALATTRRAWQAARSKYYKLRRGYIIEQYFRAGTMYGRSVSQLFVGECVDLETKRLRWAKYERLYATLGFRTVATADFIEYGGYGKDIEYLMRVTRTEGEEPVLYAEAAAGLNTRETLAPLVEFGGERQELPHCHLNHKHDTADGAHDCDLIGCRKQNKPRPKPTKAGKRSRNRWRERR